MPDIIAATFDHLIIKFPDADLSAWTGMLRHGVGVALTAPVSVHAFMVTVLGMDAGYALSSVPGLFVNSAPVDDWDQQEVGAGDAVGMSGTMPGLCGIALRRQSPIKSFRPDLTAALGQKREAGVVTVRMFNFVAQDCVRTVLERGVLVSGPWLLSYMEAQSLDLDNSVCLWNGAAIGPPQLREVLAAAATDIVLRIHTEAE